MDLLCLVLGALALVLAAAAGFLAVRLGAQASALGAARHALDAARAAAQAAELKCAEAVTRATFLAPLEGRLEAAHEMSQRLRAELAARDARVEADDETLQNLRAELAARDARLDAARDLLQSLQAELAARDERLAAEREAQQAFRAEIEERFRNLAGAALKSNEESFLNLAAQVFEKHKALDVEAAEKRRLALDQLVEPISRTLAETRQQLERIEKERDDSFGQIKAQLACVGQEAARLAHALKSSPGARGRWGEQSLKNALELAGLSPHCDFDTQVTFRTGDGTLRPDCVIRLPGNRHIVVDAKTSLEAYLDGCATSDEAQREACLKRHADDLRKHMLLLSRKEYWDAVTNGLAARPDFVAMFVPGENFFSAAVERNSGLLNEAIEKGVFIVTPMTLIALAKAIALGWQQEAIAENARHVADLGRDLYRRLAIMGDHVLKLGRSLEDGVKAYNGFVGSLETSVMPQARRFRDLAVADASKELKLLEPLQADLREPARTRDLRFGAEAEVLGLVVQN